MARRLTKVKWDGKQVVIRFEDTRPNGTDEFELVCHDPPLPAFGAALKALRQHVEEITELPADYCENLEIRGVSLSYADAGGMGAVITCLKPLTTTRAPLVLN